MLNKSIRFVPQPNGIFSENFKTNKPETVLPEMPIKDYCGYLDPRKDEKAVKKGDMCAAEVNKNIIADFEKNDAYCKKHGIAEPDRMVHVSTFKRIDGMIYMTYYANVGSDAENPFEQEARLAFCPENAPEDMNVVTVLKVGDKLDGKTVDRVYDTVMMYKGGDILYILWTAAVDGLYYRFYRTFNIKTLTFGEIRPNRFRVGNIENDFSTTGIISALTENGLPYKKMYSDIGIMQKLSSREENGKTYYYTGAYSGHFTCIIKSCDFINWEYVSAPDFENMSQWENATYVLDNKVYYFVRQLDDCRQGFLTYFDLGTGKWAKPFLIRDAQSRSDFFMYKEKLYMIHAPKDREGFGIVEIGTNDISDTKPILVADMHDSLFYPFTEVFGDTVYISYTVNRKHIRLSHFDLCDYLGDVQ